MTTRIMASLKQQHEIAINLSMYCSSNEQGFAVYKDGWNDAAIATAVNEKLPNEVYLCTEKQVKTRRKQVYGQTPSGTKNDLEVRVTLLESHLAHLVKQVETLAGSRYVKYVPPMGRPRSTPPSEE